MSGTVVVVSLLNPIKITKEKRGRVSQGVGKDRDIQFKTMKNLYYYLKVVSRNYKLF